MGRYSFLTRRSQCSKVPLKELGCVTCAWQDTFLLSVDDTIVVNVGRTLGNTEQRSVEKKNCFHPVNGWKRLTEPKTDSNLFRGRKLSAMSGHRPSDEKQVRFTFKEILRFMESVRWQDIINCYYDWKLTNMETLITAVSCIS